MEPVAPAWLALVNLIQNVAPYHCGFTDSRLLNIDAVMDIKAAREMISPKDLLIYSARNGSIPPLLEYLHLKICSKRVKFCLKV